MTRLCAICESIPYESLPEFPSHDYMENHTGCAHFQQLFAKSPEDSGLAGFKHYSDLESLRRAAKEGCRLCQLIEAQADNVLSEFDREEKPRLEALGAGEDACLKFDLRITKRPDGQGGIWVLASCPEPEEPGVVAVVPVATTAFCARQGIRSTVPAKRPS